MFVATDSGAAEITVGKTTQTVLFVKDKTRVREGDPLLAAVGHAFAPMDDDYPDDEQATDAPGEGR